MMDRIVLYIKQKYWNCMKIKYRYRRAIKGPYNKKH